MVRAVFVQQSRELLLLERNHEGTDDRDVHGDHDEGEQRAEEQADTEEDEDICRVDRVT